MRKNSFISGVFWSFGERIIAQLVSFIVSVVLARMLSPYDYGVVAILLIFISLADVFVSNGFGTALIQDKDADTDDFSTIFYCSFIVSIFIYVILFFLAPCIAGFYNDNSITIFLRVLSIRIPISSYNTIQRAYISRNMMFKKFFYITLIGTSISAFVGIFLAYKGAGAWALIAQYLSNTIIDSITLTRIVTLKLKPVFKLERAKILMTYGWKVLAAELIGTLFDHVQSLTIGKVFTSKDLAFYNKGNQIPSMISANINNSVMTVLFPAIANKGDNFEEVKLISRKSIRMMIYIVFPIMILLSFISRPIILILLTDKWENSIIYMSILCYSVSFSLIGNTGLQTIKAVGRSDLLLKIELYKKPIFILMMIIGLKFSVVGVAIASTLYSLYAMIINFGTMGRIINYNFFDQLKDIFNVGKLSLYIGVILYLCKFLNFHNNWIEVVFKSLLAFILYILLSKINRCEEFTFIINYLRSKIIR